MNVRVGAVVAALVMGSGCGGGGDADGGAPDGSARDSAVVVCERNADCGDLYCAPMTCRPGDPLANAAGCVASASPCAAGELCDEASASCVTRECADDPDADDDGHDSMACGGDDCDDGDANRHPGNAEVCDAEGHDEDCVPSTLGGTDADSDGFVSASCCNGTACGEDCDDSLADVRPGVAEVCNGRDDDCDGTADEPGGELPLCPGGVCTAGSCRLDPWVHTFGGPGGEMPGAIAMDRAANVYVAGVFEGTAAFDGGDLTARLGTTNHVVVAYSGDGTHRWDHPIAGSGLDENIVLAARADGSSVFVAATFRDTVDVGGGSPFSATGSYLYVAELRATDGEVLRHRVISSSGRLTGVVSAAGSVMLTGITYGSFELEGTAVDGGYLLELDETLATREVRPLMGVSDVRAMAPRPSGGFVVAAAAFGVVDLGCSPTTGGAGVDSILIAAFDASGGCDWVYSRDVDALDFWDIAVGRSGQVYAAAHYAVPVDFGGGERPAAAVTNGVILALDATGTYRWDRVFTSPTSATLSGVDAKLDGVVAVGWFGDSLTVGGSTLAGSTFESSVLIEFSPEGAVRRSRTFAATANNAAVDVVVGIGDSTAVVGRWQGSITLEGTTYLSRTSSGGGASPDVYIIRPAGI